MRIGMVLVSQETDTFNPAPTTVDHFASYGIHRGRDVLDHAERGQVAGHLAAASERGGVETIPIFSTKAVAGGRLSADTLGFLVDEVVTGIEGAGALDGLALQLHGACVAEGVDDVEGHLLRLVRDVVGADLPIGLGLDHHANITADIVSLATFIVGHRTQPHDLFDTGLITSRLLFQVVAGEVVPVSARLIVTTPSSSGCRNTSSVVRLNSGNSSRNSTPLWLVVISPGVGTLPPPTSPALLMV